MTGALRFDLLHAGTPLSESYSITAVHRELQSDTCLAGSLDPRGEYRWVLVSPDGRVLASRGFSALFAEWQSTVVGESEEQHADFSESHCIPWYPDAIMRIERRVQADRYRTVFEFVLQKQIVAAAGAEPTVGQRILRQLHGRGGVHFLLVSEGYTATESDRFFHDARRASETILAASPYRELACSLSVSALLVPCRESGIPPTPGRSEDTTSFATAYNTFGMARYLVPLDLHALRRATTGIQHATLIVLANSSNYGGSGVFNSNCCVAAQMACEDFSYVLLHELGHSLGGLADEYFGGPIAYSIEADAGKCAWEPNVSLLDENGRVKWASRISPDVPVPTPWSHAEYLRLAARAEAANRPGEEGSVASADRTRRRSDEAQLLAREPYRGRIGAFTGAHYRPFGMYRPEVDCRMFSRSAETYCTICTETITQAIGVALGSNTALTPQS